MIFEAWGNRRNIALTPGGFAHGEVVIRPNSMIVQDHGAFTFADIRQTNGTMVPVSICVRPVSRNSSGAKTSGDHRTSPVAERVNATPDAADEGLDAAHPKPGGPIDEMKLRSLKWGPPATNGLRAACYFEPSKEIYTDFEVVKRWKVFHNSGNEPVVFSVAVGGDVDRWTALDEQDRPVPTHQLAGIGPLAQRIFRLEPSHAVEVRCPATGIGTAKKATLDAGETEIAAKVGTTCRVHWVLNVDGINRSDNYGPTAGVWQGKLTTGEVRFRMGPPDTTAPPPGAAAGIDVETFGPVVERTVTSVFKDVPACFLDLDSGEFCVPPTNLWADLRGLAFTGTTDGSGAAPGSPLANWLKKSGGDLLGCDLEHGATLLFCGTTPTAVINPFLAFDEMTPDRLLNHFSVAKPEPGKVNVFEGVPVLRVRLHEEPYNKANLIFFRTQAGGLGVVQFVDFTDNPRGLRIRYKLVQAAISSPGEQAVQGRPTEDPGEVSAVAGNVADVGSHPAAPGARLKLQQAQMEFARIRALFELKLVSQSEYEAAQSARDLAEAEWSGDTAAISRVKLQQAQQQFLQATQRREAGLASEDEVQKAQRTRDLAEARLSGDPAAIASAQLRLAQQQFLRAEGLFKAGLSSQAEFEQAMAARDAAQAELSVTGSRTNSDDDSSVMGHVYVCGGKALQDLEGLEQGWKVEHVQPPSNGCITNTGETAHLSTKTKFGKEDLTVNAALALDQLNGSGAAFTFGNGYAFEFDRADGRFDVSGPTGLKTYQRVGAAGVIVPGKRFVFTARRRGSALDFLIDNQLVHGVEFDGPIGAVGFAPHKGTMRIFAFGAYEMPPRNVSKAPKAPPTTEAEAKQDLQAKRTYLRHLAEGVLKFAEQNNGLMPKDLAQSFSVRAPLASPPFPPRMFEVVCQGLLQEIKDASQTLLIREKEAVRTPDGQWMKCYAFADTHVEVHVEPAGQFDAWEQPRLKVIKAPKPPGTILSQDTAGIGVVLGREGEHVFVKSFTLDSVAERSKEIRIGDRITAVAPANGPPVPVKGLSEEEVVRLIRGPKGAAVRLTIVSPGTGASEAREVRLVREELKGTKPPEISK
jgi:hypothetical protein